MMTRAQFVLRPPSVKGAALAGLLCVAPFALATAGGLPAETEARLSHLVRHDCGSCHGMTLKGGLGPALLPEALDAYDDDSLVQVILGGIPDKAMPPWRDLLSESEARWIVRRLKEGFPQ